MCIRDRPGREPSRIDRKSLRHVLYGNNPRSLTRRLQAKLNPRADRIKEETACTQASPNSIFHAPRRPRKGPRKLVRKWVVSGQAKHPGGAQRSRDGL